MNSKKNNEIASFLAEMQNLLDSKELLDDILVYYKIYDKEFDNQTLRLDEYAKSDSLSYETLNYRIRKYLAFDDAK